MCIKQRKNRRTSIPYRKSDLALQMTPMSLNQYVQSNACSSLWQSAVLSLLLSLQIGCYRIGSSLSKFILLPSSFNQGIIPLFSWEREKWLYKASKQASRKQRSRKVVFWRRLSCLYPHLSIILVVPSATFFQIRTNLTTEWVSAVCLR